MSPWKSWIVAEKARRCFRTVFFVAAMAVSLLASSLPVLAAVADVAVTCALVSGVTCLTCRAPGEHLRHYSFRSSVIDVPFVSFFRSLAFICLSWVCNAPAVAHGPYLGTVSMCSFGSILLVSVKACVFTVNTHMEAEASPSVASPKEHLKKSLGMPVLLLSSAVFGIVHVMVAYRISCRARRKLLYHKIDQEAVLSCKGHRRSLTFTHGKILTYDSGTKHYPFRGMASAWKGEGLDPRALAGPDSSFVTIRGLNVHYKLCLPFGPPRTLTTGFCDPTQEMGVRRLRLDKQVSNLTSQTRRHHLHRSYSIQLDKSSLYDPLLDSYPTSPVSMFDTHQNNDVHQLGSVSPADHLDGSCHFGVVLVHGFGGGVFQWRHVMAELSQQLGCIVAAYDRPGWGLTSRLLRKDWEERDLTNPYNLESQVDLLLSFCSEMGFSSVVLLGHDDGGLLALRAAERVQAPTFNSSIAIRGVVLLNVSLSREVVPAFARILLHTSLRKKHLVRPLLRAEITQVVNRRAWCNTAKFTTDILMLYKAPLFVEAWDEALSEISRLSYEMVLSPQNAASLLKSVGDLPVLVVAGAEDSLVPLKSSQAQASKLLNSRLVMISGCGHLPHEECPEALVSALTSFISRLVPTPPET